jgi:catechol 2,3-dioxygenase-like lactoylglutathione lyase family enzyme
MTSLAAGSSTATASRRAVIAGAHTLIYAEDAGAARAFLRDVLGFSSVDAGDGWLIFELPPGELGVHPGPGGGRRSDSTNCPSCATTSRRPSPS